MAATKAFLDADAPNQPPGTTRSPKFPTSALTTLHVQFAWDGTPSDADNREEPAIRVTVWGPENSPSLVQDTAAGIRARFLRYASADVFRVDRGAGRLPGVDPDTRLQFCTFTVQPVLRATVA